MINLRQGGEPGPAPVGGGASGAVWDDERDTITNVERAIGGRGDDLLYGNNGRNELYGLGGADTIYGYAGRDYLAGGGGNDILYANHSDSDRDDSRDDVFGDDHSGSPGDICHITEDDDFSGCEVVE